MQLILQDSAEENTQQPGVCYVKAWPTLTTDDINILTDEGCAITKYVTRNESTYTTAILFTLNNINSSCQKISCFTPLNIKVKHIRISKC